MSVLVVDPEHGERWIEIRGRGVEMTSTGAEAHADSLTDRYSGGHKHHFYGDIFPVEQKQPETRVIVRIQPVRIAKDARFK